MNIYAILVRRRKCTYIYQLERQRNELVWRVVSFHGILSNASIANRQKKYPGLYYRIDRTDYDSSYKCEEGDFLEMIS